MNSHNMNMTLLNDKNNNNNDVMIIRMVCFIAFCTYILSLYTVGLLSITHTWLFTNLTAVQPTCESIAALRGSSNNDTSPQQQHRRGQQQRQQRRAGGRNHPNRRSNNHHNNRGRNERSEGQQQNNNYSSPRTLDEQLTILEFITIKVRPGVIALQQYRRLRNNTTTSGNDTTTAASTTTTNNTNEKSDAFDVWKYLETSVLCCIACFAILIIRWMSHIRNCQYYANSLLLLLSPSSNDNVNSSHIQQHRLLLLQKWDTIYNDEKIIIESNDARWWLMVFILVTTVTWFHLADMASHSYPAAAERRTIRYSPISYLSGIVVSYLVWYHIGVRGVTIDEDEVTAAKMTSQNNLHHYWHFTIDCALDELSSRLLLLARLLGWKMNGQMIWDIIRRSLRIIVTLFCGYFGFVLADPLRTFQQAMIYRLYVGSGNDIQYNQLGIRNSSSRWRNTQSKRIIVMETIWKMIVMISLFIPVWNLGYIHYYGLDHGFSRVGSSRVTFQIAYVIVLCVLVRRFQQDYLLSALPAVVKILENNNASLSYNNRMSSQRDNHGMQPVNHHDIIDNNGERDDTDNNGDDDDDDLNHIITYPFVLRIETILRNGTKLVCIPLLLAILFGISNISDFQRGETIYPSAYGGPWILEQSVHRWHRDRTLTQMSTFIPSINITDPNFVTRSIDTEKEDSTSGAASSCPSTSGNFFKDVFRIQRRGNNTTNSCKVQQGTTNGDSEEKIQQRKEFDLRAAAEEPLPITMLSALRKLQKLAKESLKDNDIRACVTGFYPSNISNEGAMHEPDVIHQQKALKLAKKKVDVTMGELREVTGALFHHPLITAETVYRLSRFLELVLCIFWVATMIPFLALSHKSMTKTRQAFLKLNASAFHANPQDAAD